MPFDLLEKARAIGNSLTARYWFALALLGVFGVLAHFVFVSSLDSELFDSATIDLSSRQRFLCVRVVHIGWQYSENKLPESRLVWKESMRQAIETMDDRYQQLLQRSLRLRKSKEIYASKIKELIFDGTDSLDRLMKEFTDFARAIIDSPEGEVRSGNPYLMCLNQNLGPLIGKLDQLTGLYEAGLHESIEDVKRLSLAILWLTIALIVVLGLFVFRPTVRKAEDELVSLAESETMIRSILNASVDAIVIVGAGGEIQEWNPQAEKLFGWSATQMKGRRIEETIIPPNLREKYRRGAADFLARGDMSVLDRRLEILGVKADGTELPLELTVVFLRRGGQGAFGYFLRDITVQKRIQSELEKHRKRLEELLRERSRQLEENYVRLKASERLAAIGEVATKIAHEIRNPLAAIQGSVRLLIRGLNLNESQEELRSDLMIEIRKLDDTVKDLLDFSRPLTAKKTFSDFGVYLEELGEYWSLHPVISKHKIEMEVESGLVGYFDLHLMNEVLTNLVLNSAQAMESSGTIRVEAKNDAGYVIVEISDTGPGIPEKSLPSIFIPFFTTKVQGTGLGLAIAKKNVEAMEGTIVARNLPTGGASFVLTLPPSDEK